MSTPRKITIDDFCHTYTIERSYRVAARSEEDARRKLSRDLMISERIVKVQDREVAFKRYQAGAAALRERVSDDSESG